MGAPRSAGLVELAAAGPRWGLGLVGVCSPRPRGAGVARAPSLVAHCRFHQRMAPELSWRLDPYTGRVAWRGG